MFPYKKQKDVKSTPAIHPSLINYSFSQTNQWMEHSLRKQYIPIRRKRKIDALDVSRNQMYQRRREPINPKRSYKQRLTELNKLKIDYAKSSSRDSMASVEETKDRGDTAANGDLSNIMMRHKQIYLDTEKCRRKKQCIERLKSYQETRKKRQQDVLKDQKHTERSFYVIQDTMSKKIRQDEVSPTSKRYRMERRINRFKATLKY